MRFGGFTALMVGICELAWQTPLAQRPEAQSPFPVHILPVPHAGQEPPPQSTSVSVPFLTPSEQLGAWHFPPVHTMLWQSRPAEHDLPAGHAGHVPPPQSTSVSLPFLDRKSVVEGVSV